MRRRNRPVVFLASLLVVLCARGATASQADEASRRKLLDAAGAGKSDEVEALLQKGVTPNFRIAEATPLLLASRRGYTDTVRVLLAGGADARLANDEGATPLIKAADGGHVDIVKLLIEAGADTNAVDKLGNSAMSIAVGSGRFEIVQELVRAKAAFDKSSVMLGAVSPGDPNVIRILAQAGADVNAVDENGHTPLMRAAAEGKAELVPVLIQYGAKVDQVNKGSRGYGETALMLAAHYGKADATRALIEAGADIDLKSSDDETALDIAESEGHPRVVEVLQAARTH